jgi:hypothetical protein
MSLWRKGVTKRIHPDLASLIEEERKNLERSMKTKVSFPEASQVFVKKRKKCKEDDITLF